MGTGYYIGAVHELKQAAADFKVTANENSVMNANATVYSDKDKVIGIMDATHSKALYQDNKTHIPLNKVIDE